MCMRVCLSKNMLTAEFFFRGILNIWERNLVLADEAPRLGKELIQLRLEPS